METFDLLLFVSALRGLDTRPMDEDEKEDEDTSTVKPMLNGVTEKSNGSDNGRSSQILYVITSSPGKPDHNMPGQWVGPNGTNGYTSSM